jgi:hypothetical protein
MADRRHEARAWDASWEGNRKALLKSLLNTTAAQRLAWLEEALELAHRTGALSAIPPAGALRRHPHPAGG